VILNKPWKLILPSRQNFSEKEPQLFDILKDPYEKNNIAPGHPEVVKELQQQLNDWWIPKS